jgi:hypothetical protein
MICGPRHAEAGRWFRELMEQELESRGGDE